MFYIPSMQFLIGGFQILLRYVASGEHVNFGSPLNDGFVGLLILCTVSKNLPGRPIYKSESGYDSRNFVTKYEVSTILSELSVST